MIAKSLISKLQSIQGVEVFENYDLTTFSTLKLKCESKCFLKVSSVKGLVEVIKLFVQNHQKYLVLGKGSNLVFPNQFNIPVLKLAFSLDLKQFDSKRDFYILPASTPLNILTGKAIKHGLGGWEKFTGIPATVGGAIYMNAGTSLGEIGDLVKEVDLLKPDGSIEAKKINPEDFSYRKNHFLNDGDIILSAKLVHEGINENIGEKIIKYLKKRSMSQPLTKNTCGCSFKNIARFSSTKSEPCVAGRIIDIMGLKGFRYKNLKVSEVHGNFIENMGGATQEDYLNLIKQINSKIKKEHGYEFELEAIILDNHANVIQQHSS